MTGVEVLSQNTIYETGVYSWIVILCISLGFVFSLIMTIIDWCNYGFDVRDIGWIFVITVSCTLLGMFCTALTEHDTNVIDYIEYKVTISEEVNFIEFTDKYEILDQEGKIYTVRERE